MAKMKLVTPDINDLADAIAQRIAWLIIKGREAEHDPDKGKCPNCGADRFIDYCYKCGFVPYWEKGPARTCTCKGHPDSRGEEIIKQERETNEWESQKYPHIKKYDPTEEPFA